MVEWNNCKPTVKKDDHIICTKIIFLNMFLFIIIIKLVMIERFYFPFDYHILKYKLIPTDLEIYSIMFVKFGKYYICSQTYKMKNFLQI